jgi:LPS sulfotransferase NodH
MKLLKKSYRQIVTYTASLLKTPQEPKRKFVLFFRPRAGSNLLCNLLNSHPEVFCDGEIFGVGYVGKVRFPNFYLKGRYAIAKKEVYGFKININQIRNLGEAQTFFSDFHQQGWKIIYIRRNNSLRQAVSFLIAQQRNEWVGTPKNTLTGKLPVNPNELVSKIERIEQAIQKEQELLAPFSPLNIIYEDELLSAGQHQTTLDRNFDFLGIDSVPVKSNMAKTAFSNDLTDIIENYDEVEKIISQTPYAHFLEEL